MERIQLFLTLVQPQEGGSKAAADIVFKTTGAFRKKQTPASTTSVLFVLHIMQRESKTDGPQT